LETDKDVLESARVSDQSKNTGRVSAEQEVAGHKAIEVEPVVENSQT